MFVYFYGFIALFLMVGPLKTKSNANFYNILAHISHQKGRTRVKNVSLDFLRHLGVFNFLAKIRQIFRIKSIK